MKRIIPILFALVLAAKITLAQDQHFSQFYNSPVASNPGNTGVFNGDLRAILCTVCSGLQLAHLIKHLPFRWTLLFSRKG